MFSKSCDPWTVYFCQLWGVLNVLNMSCLTEHLPELVQTYSTLYDLDQKVYSNKRWDLGCKTSSHLYSVEVRECGICHTTSIYVYTLCTHFLVRWNSSQLSNSRCIGLDPSLTGLANIFPQNSCFPHWLAQD